MERFLDEARTPARFPHPNVVRVRDCFEANRTAYIVMDYEDGKPLDALLRRHGTLTESQLKRIVLPLADGLREVHAAGFLHRDAKPANIGVILLVKETKPEIAGMFYVFTNYSDYMAEAICQETMRQVHSSAESSGYRMGQKIEAEPDGIDSHGLYIRYVGQNVPEPFASLRLVYTPNAGLCGITAITDTDDYDACFSNFGTCLRINAENPPIGRGEIRVG